jgi:hypothetical protein
MSRWIHADHAFDRIAECHVHAPAENEGHGLIGGFQDWRSTTVHAVNFSKRYTR